MQNNIISKLKSASSISIIDDAYENKLIPIVDALLRGNIDIIMFNHAFYLDIRNLTKHIELIKNHFGDKITIGVANTNNKEHIDYVKNAGADFIILPDSNIELIDAAKKSNIFAIPTAISINDISTAINSDAKFVKIFPINTSFSEFNYITLLNLENSENFDTNNLNIKQIYKIFDKINLNIINFEYWNF